MISTPPFGNYFLRSGKCHVCGKSTKLLIHQACSDKLYDEKKEKKRLRRGKAAQKNYKSGHIPPFSKDS